MANEQVEIQDLSTEEIKDRATDLFESNKNIIYGIAIFTIILVGAFWFYKHQYMAPRSANADDEIYKSDQLMEQDSFALALNGKPAAVGQAGGSIGYTGVISKYSGTPAANIAHYKAGAACLRMGQAELALKYLKNYSGPEELQTQAYNMMGDAASSINKTDEALGYYQKAANNTGNVSLVVYSLYKAGKLLEHTGDLARAKKYYTQVLQKDRVIGEQLGVDKDLIRLVAN